MILSSDVTKHGGYFDKGDGEFDFGEKKLILPAQGAHSLPNGNSTREALH